MSVELESLTYRYPGSTGSAALRDLSLTIETGSITGIMGHTGCGKSTMIQLIAGLLRPTEGKVRIDGEDIFSPLYRRSILREKLGIVFQHPESQIFESTVEKDVGFSLQRKHLTKAEKDERIRRALTLMGFDYEKIRTEAPLALSGGEQRRIAIAGILVSDPDLLIFDEPFSSLDPKARLDFMELIRGLNRNGKTILIVSHSADLLSGLCTEILLLQDGELFLKGTPEEVFYSNHFQDCAGMRLPLPVLLTLMLRERCLPLRKNHLSLSSLKDELTELRREGRL